MVTLTHVLPQNVWMRNGQRSAYVGSPVVVYDSMFFLSDDECISVFNPSIVDFYTIAPFVHQEMSSMTKMRLVELHGVSKNHHGKQLPDV